MTWMIRCFACDGKGERYADPRGDQNGKGLKLIQCPVCEGTGEVSAYLVLRSLSHVRSEGRPQVNERDEVLLEVERGIWKWEIVHACPEGDSGNTPCCDTLVFDLPPYHRMTLEPARVTCRGSA